MLNLYAAGNQISNFINLVLTIECVAQHAYFGQPKIPSVVVQIKEITMTVESRYFNNHLLARYILSRYYFMARIHLLPMTKPNGN